MFHKKQGRSHFKLIFLILLMMASHGVSSSGAEGDNKTKISESPDSVFKLQFFQSQWSHQQSDQLIPYAFQRLSLNYGKLNLNLHKFVVELQQEQSVEVNQVIANQFFVETLDQAPPGLRWGLGYMPVPLTMLNQEDDQLFLFRPYFHRQLFSDTQLNEYGGHLGYRLQNIELRMGVFHRLNYTSEKEGAKASEMPPHFIQSRWWWDDIAEVRISYYNEKDWGLTAKPTWGTSFYLHTPHWEMQIEAWQQWRNTSSYTLEVQHGGYLFAAYTHPEWGTTLGIRHDYFARPDVKDINSHNRHHSVSNSAWIFRWQVHPDLLLQLESTQEVRQQSAHITPLVSGLSAQLNYDISF